MWHIGKKGYISSIFAFVFFQTRNVRNCAERHPWRLFAKASHFANVRHVRYVSFRAATSVVINHAARVAAAAAADTISRPAVWLAERALTYAYVWASEGRGENGRKEGKSETNLCSLSCAKHYRAKCQSVFRHIPWKLNAIYL